jgi:hypothetical protein
MNAREKRQDQFAPALQGKHVARTILNSLSAHVAILDENGYILETNRAWTQFAEANQIHMRPDTLKATTGKFATALTEIPPMNPIPWPRGFATSLPDVSKNLSQTTPATRPMKSAGYICVLPGQLATGRAASWSAMKTSHNSSWPKSG